MGGEWDSTNVADGQVAVFTPIALDHTARLGSHDRRDRAHQVGHHQAGGDRRDGDPARSRRSTSCERAAELTEATLAVEGVDFAVSSRRRRRRRPARIDPRTRGRVRATSSCRSTATTRRRTRRVAIAAVESFLGGGIGRLADAMSCTRASPRSTSPGRLQLVGIEPTVLVDAAHNPHGAAALAAALDRVLRLRRVRVRARRARRQGRRRHRRRARARWPLASIVTQSDSDRARRRRPTLADDRRRAGRRRSRAGVRAARRRPRRRARVGGRGAEARRGRHRLDHARRRGAWRSPPSGGWKCHERPPQPDRHRAAPARSRRRRRVRATEPRSRSCSASRPSSSSSPRS